MQRITLSFFLAICVSSTAAVAVHAQQPGYRPSRFPGVNVRSMPRSAPDKFERGGKRRRNAPPVIRKGERPGDGDTVQLNDDYMVHDTKHGHAPVSRSAAVPNKRKATSSRAAAAKTKAPASKTAVHR